MRHLMVNLTVIWTSSSNIRILFIYFNGENSSTLIYKIHNNNNKLVVASSPKWRILSIRMHMCVARGCIRPCTTFRGWQSSSGGGGGGRNKGGWERSSSVHVIYWMERGRSNVYVLLRIVCTWNLVLCCWCCLGVDSHWSFLCLSSAAAGAARLLAFDSIEKGCWMDNSNIQVYWGSCDF